jgi:hypothetical protein
VSRVSEVVNYNDHAVPATTGMKIRQLREGKDSCVVPLTRVVGASRRRPWSIDAAREDLGQRNVTGRSSSSPTARIVPQ